MNAYEMTFIVRPDRDEEATRAVVETVTGRISAAGGEIIAAIPWNPPRRRMAYTIRDFGDGFYVTTVFRLDPQALRSIENTLKLNDNILRFLVVQATDLNIKQAQQRLQQQQAPAPPPHAVQPSTAGAPAAPESQASEPEAAPPLPTVPAEFAPEPVIGTEATDAASDVTADETSTEAIPTSPVQDPVASAAGEPTPIESQE